MLYWPIPHGFYLAPFPEESRPRPVGLYLDFMAWRMYALYRVPSSYTYAFVNNHTPSLATDSYQHLMEETSVLKHIVPVDNTMGADYNDEYWTILMLYNM